MKTVFAPLVSEKCLNTGAGDLNFPQGVDSVVVRILKPGGAELFKGKYGKESLSKSGDILITGLAPGSDYTVEVFGCSGNEAVWSGRSRNVTISEHMKSSPYIYLTKIGDFSCTGFSGKIGGSPVGSSVMSEMRAFHATAVDEAGNIFISGGFRNFKVGNLTASAESSIDFYSEDYSVFFEFGGLTVERGFHAMFPVGGGKLLIAGGIRNAEFKITEQGLPIMPYGKKSDYLPLPFEIFDIGNKTSTTYLPEAEVAPFSAILHIPGKNLLMVSGGLTDDMTNSTELIVVYDAGGEGVAVKYNLLMSHGRVGHAAVQLAGGDIALIGGSTKSPIEVVSLETGKGIPVEIKGEIASLPFVFFSLTPLKNAGEFLFSGGNMIISDKPLAVHKIVTNANLFRLKLTKEGAEEKYTAEITPLASDKEQLFERSFGMSFSRDDSLFLSGGYRSFATVVGVEECEGRPDCLLRSLIRYHIEDNKVVVDADKYMYFPRFGSGITGLSDGTELITGGFIALNADNVIVSTAEIYNPGTGIPVDICQ